jgi:cephalosporin-C deacetylase-like acetyl esterase
MSRPAVWSDHPDARYRVGDTVRFVVADGEGWPYRITWDGADPIDDGVVAGGPLEVPARGPGFIRCTIGDPGSPEAEAAAAVDPHRLTPTLPPPEDFETFWGDQLERLPRRPELEIALHVEHETDCVYGVSADSGDAEIGAVHAWLHVPRDRKRAAPLVVRYHGSGVYAVPEENGREWARSGRIALSPNPHAIPNDWPEERYLELQEGDLADYRTRGRERRETLYFVPMFLRAALVARMAACLPDDIARWDGRYLAVEGHSQGGGQALATLGLDGRVTALIVSCPTHCDHAGPRRGRPAGWPQLVEWEETTAPAQLEAARYIDGVNFAAWTAAQGRRVESLFGVCYLDGLCPPTGVFEAHNALSGDRAVHHEPATGHTYTDQFRQATFRWAEAHLPVAA